MAARRSAARPQVFVAPGNAGTAREPGLENVAITRSRGAGRVRARTSRSHLTVVGPEAPLAAGVVDALRDAGLRIFGPTRAPRSSRAPRTSPSASCSATASRPRAYAGFTDAGGRARYVDAHGAPIVIKADGLAAGKGVVVAMTVEEAHAAIEHDARRQQARRRRPSRGDRGVPGRRGGELHRHVRRRERAAARHEPGPQASSTATRAPTPAAWAPTRRRRW